MSTTQLAQAEFSTHIRWQGITISSLPHLGGIVARQRILVVELSSHFKCLEQLAFLLRDDFALSFILLGEYSRQGGASSWKSMFPSHTHYSTTVARLSAPMSLWIMIAYLRIGLRALRCDTVLISTGPEDGSPRNARLFNIVLRLTRKRIVWIVRNPGKYFTEPACDGVQHSLGALGRAALRCDGLLFETETQLRFFLSALPSVVEGTHPRMRVVFDRYADYPWPEIEPDAGHGAPRSETFTLTVGLLGVLSPARRNYDVVYEALSLLPTSVLDSIEFITLGAALCDLAAIAKRLSSYCRVDLVSGWLSESQFKARGSGCDVLLSPMDLKSEYGTAHGSGSFGDAIALQRPLISPGGVDPCGEFADIILPYSDALSLAKLLEKLTRNRPEPLHGIRLNRFTKSSVLPSVKEVLLGSSKVMSAR